MGVKSWVSAQIETATWRAEPADWHCEQPSLSPLPIGLVRGPSKAFKIALKRDFSYKEPEKGTLTSPITSHLLPP